MDRPLLCKNGQKHASSIRKNLQHRRDRLDVLPVSIQRHCHGMDQILARRLRLHGKTAKIDHAREEAEPARRHRTGHAEIHRAHGASFSKRKTWLHTHPTTAKIQLQAQRTRRLLQNTSLAREICRRISRPGVDQTGNMELARKISGRIHNCRRTSASSRNAFYIKHRVFSVARTWNKTLVRLSVFSPRA